MSGLAAVVDRALEWSVIGSFTRIGPAVRSRIFDWDDAARLPRLDGKVVLVTGATSGIGEATATALARQGATVRVLARNPTKAAATVTRIRAETGNADVRAGIADLASLDSVRSFAENFAADHDRLDVLVHNAGALLASHECTEDGIETTVQTHLVAPYLLTRLLQPQLERAAPSRVVWVSSGGMYTQRFDLDALEPRPEDFDGTVAYARAKRAQVVLAGHLASSLAARGVHVHAMHPGWAATPGVETSLPRFHRVLRPLLRSAEEGADTVVWLSTADEPADHPGGFWLDRRRRAEHKVPWTRPLEPQVEAEALVRWCDQLLAPSGT